MDASALRRRRLIKECHLPDLQEREELDVVQVGFGAVVVLGAVS